MKTLTPEDFTEETKVTLKDLHESTAKKLLKAGVEELLPVQQYTYKLFIDGNEIVVKSRTGTGKTLSFLLPLEELIRRNKEAGKSGIQAIILEPTRELASQVQTQVEKFTNLTSVLVYGGGDSRSYQMRQIKHARPDILVCTPGRLIDMLTNDSLKLSEVRYQILDEGDKMLDMGFEQDIVEIQKHLNQDEDGTKSMIFSATVPGFIQELAAKRLKNPTLIDLVGNDTTQVPDRIENRAVLIKDEQQMFKHIQGYVEANRNKKVIIFAETKQTVKDFEKFTYAQFLTLHGDLEQNQREIRLNRFRDKNSKAILVATDVASRGLDIDDIDVVIQCGCRHIDSFVHRSGRTGRIGKTGLNVLFFQPEDFKFVLDLESQLNIKLNIQQSVTEEEADSEQIEAKIIGDFAKKAHSLKFAHFHHSGNAELMNKFRELFDTKADVSVAAEEKEAREKLREKMLNTLILNYIDTHHQGAHQVGFLTGLKTYNTYLIKIEHEPGKRKTSSYNQIKDDVRQLFETLRVENNFEFGPNGTNYLADLNAEKLRKLDELIKSSDVQGLDVTVTKVTTIGEDEKKILSRRYSRGGHR